MARFGNYEDNVVAILYLRRNIWQQDVRRSIMNKGLKRLSDVIEDRIKGVIDDSTPAGRAYKVGNKTARITAATKGNKRVKGTKTRVIVGGKFHIASAPGQPPAKFTLTLYKSIKVTRVPGKWSVLASVNAPGVDVLDDPSRLNRLFFYTTVKTFYDNEFENEAREIIRELLS